jgi:4-amino-4-deoxy-L-arabinose transferase-like glycosyltransferase
VRLYRLDHFSYGLDEILQGFWIQGDWAFFWKSLKFDAVHPPLDYLIARGVEVFGPADWARKLPAVFWGTATVPVLAALVGRRAGKVAGLLTALLLAAAPFHVRYSQEFRPYALGVFLLCLSLLCLDLFLERPGVLRLLALYFACLATAYALYLAAAVLGLAAAAMLAEDSFTPDSARRRAARRFLAWSPPFLLLLFLAYLPWLPVVIEAGRRAPMAPTPLLTFERFARILSFFAFSAADGHAPRLSDAFFLLLALGGATVAFRAPRLRFLPVWAVGGFAALECLGQLHPHFDTPNRFLPVGAAIPALAAVFLSGLARRKNGPAIATTILVLVLAFDCRSLGAYFRDGRADWRPLGRFLRGQPRQERIFTENQYSELCVAFYVEGPEWLSRGGRLGRDVWNLDGEIVRLTWSWKPGTTAWLVLAGEPVHEPLRRWAAAFPSTPFPTAEGAVLHRLDPAFRDAVFPPPR